VAFAVSVVAIAWLLGPALFSGSVLSAGDVMLFTPPYAAERPADLKRPSNSDLGDAVWVFHPNLLQTRDELHDGRLPRWNPEISAGRPHAAQQGGLYYPIHGLAYVLPFWDSLEWIAALKLLIAAMGMFFFCRALGLRPAACILGSVAFAFGTGFVVALEHPQASIYALVPWLFLLVERICRIPRAADAILLGGLLGAAGLAGHPESIVVVLFGLMSFCGLRLAQRRRAAGARSGVARRAVFVAGGLALSAVVAGVAVVPLFEGLTQAPELRLEGPPLERRGVLSFFFPEMWGRPDKVAFQAEGPEIFAGRAFYFGAAPLLLGVVGLVVRRTPVQLLFAGMALLCAALVIDTPVATVAGELPVLSEMTLKQFMYLLNVATGVVAAYGLHHAMSADRRDLRRIAIVMTGAALVPVLWILSNTGVLSEWREAVHELPVMRENPASFESAALGSVLRWVALALATVGVAIAALRRNRWGIGLAGLVVMLTVADLVTLGRGYHPSIAKDRAMPPDPPALTELKRRAGSSRVVGVGVTVPSNLIEAHDLKDVRGSDLPPVKRHLELYEALGGSAHPRGSITWFESGHARAKDLLDLFSVRYVLLDDQPAPPQWGLRPIVNLPQQQLAENTGALPRAFVAYGWREADGFEDALRGTVAGRPRDLAGTPIIEGAGAKPSSRPPTPAIIRDENPDRVEVEVTAAQPGQLVLNDTFYPGWTAEVDGQEEPIRAANTAFRAVGVPAGRHTVTFSYRPLSFRVGTALSAAGLLVVVVGLPAALLIGRRRRARGEGAARPPEGEIV
jgi:hypothetical protein